MQAPVLKNLNESTLCRTGSGTTRTYSTPDIRKSNFERYFYILYFLLFTCTTQISRLLTLGGGNSVLPKECLSTVSLRYLLGFFGIINLRGRGLLITKRYRFRCTYGIVARSFVATSQRVPAPAVMECGDSSVHTGSTFVKSEHYVGKERRASKCYRRDTVKPGAFGITKSPPPRVSNRQIWNIYFLLFIRFQICRLLTLGGGGLVIPKGPRFTVS